MVDYNAVTAEYRHETGLFPPGDLPENHLNITGNDDYFAPVFTMAKFQQEGDRVLLPVSVQVYHGVCDGFHAARFINTLQLMCDNILN
jgi:chloramphenicol O-acetyltransferase type A